MRTLPLRQAAIAGESLPAYVTRYATCFGLAPGNVLDGLGLRRGRRTSYNGLRLSPTQLQGASQASGLAPEVIRAMTPERYAGTAFSPGSGAGRGHLPHSVTASEILPCHSRACSACLAEDGVWRLRWHLAWSILCPRHAGLLIAECPVCGGRLNVARRTSWPRDAAGEIRDPCACWNRAGARFCRFELSGADPVSLTADPDLLGAQRHLDAVIDGTGVATIAGAEVAPLAYLRALRALGTLLRGYEEFAAGRPEELRRAAAKQDEAGGNLLRSHAVLAAVLPEAIRLARLPDSEALTDGLREVIERRHRSGGSTPSTHSGPGAPPEPLAAALLCAGQTTSFAPVSRRMGFDHRAHRRPADLDARLQVRHVPQLFWAEDYERSLHSLFEFDRFSPSLARRFCSALLARLLAPLDWVGAERFLGLPGSSRAGRSTQGSLRRAGRFEELVTQIKTAANERAARGPLVDYQARRDHLSDWEGIDSESWLHLRPKGRRIGRPGRRAHASIWIWCELTSGHEQSAPIALPERHEHVRQDQTRFKRRFLEPLRERLLVFGELLLETPADSRSELPAQLAAALRDSAT